MRSLRNNTPLSCVLTHSVWARTHCVCVCVYARECVPFCLCILNDHGLSTTTHITSVSRPPAVTPPLSSRLCVENSTDGHATFEAKKNKNKPASFDQHDHKQHEGATQWHTLRYGRFQTAISNPSEASGEITFCKQVPRPRCA